MSSAQQREELHRTIWNIADELRGAPSEDDLKGLFSDFNVDNSQLGADVKTRNKLIAKLSAFFTKYFNI